MACIAPGLSILNSSGLPLFLPLSCHPPAALRHGTAAKEGGISIEGKRPKTCRRTGRGCSPEMKSPEFRLLICLTSAPSHPTVRPPSPHSRNSLCLSLLQHVRPQLTTQPHQNRPWLPPSHESITNGCHSKPPFAESLPQPRLCPVLEIRSKDSTRLGDSNSPVST